MEITNGPGERKEMEKNTTAQQEIQAQLVVEKQNEGPTASHLQTEKDKQGEIIMQGLQALTLEPISEDLLTDQAPPGFEGPPRYKTASRRSPRLLTKNPGRYMSVIDKARAMQGFITVTQIMQKLQKPKGKGKPAPKPTLDYLNSYEPLTQNHAEVLVAAAGAELDENLKWQIQEAVKEPEWVASPEAAN